jgi:MinD superfamily P-loop ATPase
LPILLEIPFQRTIAEIYSRGGLLVEQSPEWRARFCQLFASILQTAAEAEVSQ